MKFLVGVGREYRTGHVEGRGCGRDTQVVMGRDYPVVRGENRGAPGKGASRGNGILL